MAECGALEASRIKQELLKNGRIVSVPVGKSMWPMLRNRKDQIVIKTVDCPLKRYDVPMYIYENNTERFYLHRIIKVRKDGRYVICGDNLWRKEYDVKDENIIGVLEGFFRGDRYIDCNTNVLYHGYVIFWRLIYPVRCILMLTRQYLGLIKSKLVKRK
ncbi:MAG: hypothetical protein E7265_08345 [Lachnospiraceae bacterium]|nr:hypothetical protein [Lachnospiraceae bacterium]